MQREVYFSWSANQRPAPYVREVFEYVNDGSSGYIIFDGYWYRRDEHTLPRPLEFTTKLVAAEPFETGVDVSGSRYEKIALRDIQTYRVSATAHTEIADTSEYWHDEEEGGEICLFPTARQRIDFNVVALVNEKAEDVRHVTYGTIWVPSSSSAGIKDISASEVEELDEC